MGIEKANPITCLPTSYAEETARSKVPATVLCELWEELLSKHDRCWGRVISNSMYPTIKRGDRVLIERINPEEVRFGDIYVFTFNDKLIIHRVLGKRNFGSNSWFVEKGDAYLETGLVPAEKVIGRVIKIRNSSHSLRTVSPSGRFFQLVLAFISYISFRLWTVIEYFLTRKRYVTYRKRCSAGYNLCFTIIYRLSIRIFTN